MVTEIDLPDRAAAIEWIKQHQRGRRNIHAAARIQAALEQKPEIEAKAKAKENQRLRSADNDGSSNLMNHEKVDTQKEVAKAAGVSVGTLHSYETVMQSSEEDIKQEVRTGQRSIDGTAWLVLDGHNRLEHWRTYDANDPDRRPEVKPVTVADREAAKRFVARRQLSRRNLNDHERITLAWMLAPELKEQAKANQRQAGEETSKTNFPALVNIDQSPSEPVKSPKKDRIDVRDEVAREAGVSRATIHAHKQVMDSEYDDLKTAVASGEKKIHTAHKEVRRRKAAMEQPGKPAVGNHSLPFLAGLTAFFARVLFRAGFASGSGSSSTWPGCSGSSGIPGGINSRGVTPSTRAMSGRSDNVGRLSPVSQWPIVCWITRKPDSVKASAKALWLPNLALRSSVSLAAIRFSQSFFPNSVFVRGDMSIWLPVWFECFDRSVTQSLTKTKIFSVLPMHD